MAPKVLLTRVTGFVGGTAFSKIHDSYPDYDYTIYIRSVERAKVIAEEYPNVKFVYGDLESTDAIEKVASEADVVVYTAESADSPSAAKAIAKGLAASHSDKNPGYYIHLSGAGILTWYDLRNNRYGKPPLPEQCYNDIKDIGRIFDLPEEAIHKEVDNIVQNIDSGLGLFNKRSMTVPVLAQATFDLGYTPAVGAGEAKWNHVHVEDLAEFPNKSVEASQDPFKKDNPEIWGKRGYYFVDGGPEAHSITFEDVVKKGYKAGLAWGINSKGEGERARKYLGWEPKAPSIKETIAESVALEAEILSVEAKYK
ncbi:hypothetical protein F53441_7542 [Fusarium austroafricanum]|uniref:NAD(P)-binding domain-containing protein n=1 Tax=Fusarium austroafricanum TaxID=2364996 RepID=A0A8H4NYB2_9HYPO|nr:hypothetical protein F53441_7542 [Fusarium austroafricanum]